MKLNLGALIKETAAIDQLVERQATLLRVSNQVRDWVQQWDDMNPASIRAFMQEHNAHGVPRDARNCVFARFLTDEVGKTVAVAQTVMVELTDDYSAVPRSIMKTTPAMFQFMRHFDQNHYPELILPGHYRGEINVLNDGATSIGAPDFSHAMWQYPHGTIAPQVSNASLNGFHFTKQDDLKFDFTNT